MSAISVNLNGKVVLITGGYGNLGKGIVDSLVHHNAFVYVLGRTESKFKRTFAGPNYSADRLQFIKCDVSLEEDFDNAFDQAVREKGEISCLINNAHFLRGTGTILSTEDFEFGISGVLTCVYKGIKAIIPVFMKQGKGKIINLSSMYGCVSPDFKVYDGLESFLNPPHYGAAKAGIVQLTKYYAQLLGKENIQVNCVSPGPFPSENVQESKEFLRRLANKTALGRIGQSEDIGGIFTFLSSDASNFITGQNILIDGGWTIT